MLMTAQQAIKVMRVLVVEPNDETRESVVAKMVSEGYENVTTATSGEDAIRLL